MVLGCLNRSSEPLGAPCGPQKLEGGGEGYLVPYLELSMGSRNAFGLRHGVLWILQGASSHSNH